MIGTVGGIFPHVAVGAALAEAEGAVISTGATFGLVANGIVRDEGTSTTVPASGTITGA